MAPQTSQLSSLSPFVEHMPSAHLVVGFCHLLCFGLVPNVIIPYALICFVPADQLPNAICFGLVPNE